MNKAVFSTPLDQGPVGLNPADTIVTRIELPFGHWAIFGKVVIRNNDGDKQNVGAHLFAEDQILTLDKSDARISGDTNQCFSLLGTLTVRERDFVHISCSGFNSVALETQLMAISVDALQGSHP